MSSAPSSSFAASWFDGLTAAEHPVQVEVGDRAFVIRQQDGAVLRTAPLDAIKLSEPTLRAPRFAYLDDGSTLEVADTAPFNEAIQASARPPSLVPRLQHSAAGSAAALALLLATLVFGYLQGVPLLARWIAFALPPAVEARLGEQFEKTLDLQMLKKTEISPQRREQLDAMLHDAAALGAPGLTYMLKSRGVRFGEGINAFSLPGGTVLLLDGLVDFANDDKQILGVLAHELGHVANKHSVRNVLQALGIGAVASATWGDFAATAANVAVVFGALRYSREFELEADAYAFHFLRANGLDAKPLIEFFEMVAEHQEGEAESGFEMLSTHPQTPDRIERLRRMSAAP